MAMDKLFGVETKTKNEDGGLFEKDMGGEQLARVSNFCILCQKRAGDGHFRATS